LLSVSISSGRFSLVISRIEDNSILEVSPQGNAGWHEVSIGTEYFIHPEKDSIAKTEKINLMSI